MLLQQSILWLLCATWITIGSGFPMPFLRPKSATVQPRDIVMINNPEPRPVTYEVTKPVTTTVLMVVTTAGKVITSTVQSIQVAVVTAVSTYTAVQTQVTSLTVSKGVTQSVTAQYTSYAVAIDTVGITVHQTSTKVDFQTALVTVNGVVQTSTVIAWQPAITTTADKTKDKPAPQKTQITTTQGGIATVVVINQPATTANNAQPTAQPQQTQAANGGGSLMSPVASSTYGDQYAAPSSDYAGAFTGAGASMSDPAGGLATTTQTTTALTPGSSLSLNNTADANSGSNATSDNTNTNSVNVNIGGAEINRNYIIAGAAVIVVAIIAAMVVCAMQKPSSGGSTVVVAGGSSSGGTKGSSTPTVVTSQSLAKARRQAVRPTRKQYANVAPESSSSDSELSSDDYEEGESRYDSEKGKRGSL